MRVFTVFWLTNPKYIYIYFTSYWIVKFISILYRTRMGIKVTDWKWSSAGNNSRSPDIVRPNFENVRPISHYDRTWWPNISPAHLELSSTRRCQSMFYVRPNLSNVRPKGRFERTYVLWIKKNYFQHCEVLHSFWITRRLLQTDFAEHCEFICAAQTYKDNPFFQIFSKNTFPKSYP